MTFDRVVGKLRDHGFTGVNVLTAPTKSRAKSQQDRQSSQELLHIYGALLTPKQYAMTSGYCLEGKSFSQIAREQGVSRQAVHEAVRGVQRLLRYYEEKLKLKEFPRQVPLTPESLAGLVARPTNTPPGIRDGVERLHALRNKITRKGIIYNSDWIVQELNDAIRVLEGGRAQGSDSDGGDGSAAGKEGRK